MVHKQETYTIRDHIFAGNIKIKSYINIHEVL